MKNRYLLKIAIHITFIGEGMKTRFSDQTCWEIVEKSGPQGELAVLFWKLILKAKKKLEI